MNGCEALITMEQENLYIGMVNNYTLKKLRGFKENEYNYSTSLIGR